MLGIKLVRLIEKHSETLSRGLTEEIRKLEPHFRLPQNSG